MSFCEHAHIPHEHMCLEGARKRTFMKLHASVHMCANVRVRTGVHDGCSHVTCTYETCKRQANMCALVCMLGPFILVGSASAATQEGNHKPNAPFPNCVSSHESYSYPYASGPVEIK